MCVTANQRVAKKTGDGTNISGKITRTSGAIILTNLLEKEGWYTISWMTEEVEIETVKCNHCQKKL